jgi:hypothetical protein
MQHSEEEEERKDDDHEDEIEYRKNEENFKSVQEAAVEDKTAPIEPEAGERKVIITRHAFSCNNAVSSSEFYRKDADPHITDYGINMTVLHGDTYRDVYTSNVVYVSCLIRTWETASLLYRGAENEEPLTLIVSPYLKEYHNSMLGITNGNYPYFQGSAMSSYRLDYEKTFTEFLKFLNVLYSSPELKNTITRPITVIYPNLVMSSFSINAAWTSSDKLKQNGGGWFSKYFSPKKPIKYEDIDKSLAPPPPPLKSNASQEEEGEEEEGEEKEEKDYYKDKYKGAIPTVTTEDVPDVIVEFEHPQLLGREYGVSFNQYVANEDYAKDKGYNIQRFLGWVMTVDIPDVVNVGNIHVVAHSHIMQSFLKSKLLKDKDPVQNEKILKYFKLIKKHNSWRLEFCCKLDNYADLFLRYNPSNLLFHGVLKAPTGTKYETLLCNTHQFYKPLNPIHTTSLAATGGRRRQSRSIRRSKATRRNHRGRNRKTKKRSKPTRRK